MPAYHIDPENPDQFIRKMFEFAFPSWFIFGSWPDTRNPTHVDIFDGDDYQIIRLPVDKAKEVISLREEFLTKLEEIIRR